MNAVSIVILGFVLIETANVVALYFFPGSKLGNSVGIFEAWEKCQRDPEIRPFVSYLVNWVAGTKLIFIALLVVILSTAGRETVLAAAIALVVSIASFFWRLFPLIRQMDRDGQIAPKNYSAVLGWMILGFILVFLVATLVELSR
jgi:hypothetical protein